MEILEKVKSSLPKEAISRIELEGSEIIVYTKDRDFFIKHEDTVRKVVEELKKRIEVRAESNLCLDEENTKLKIMEIVPAEARIRDIYFEPERSLVIIASEKPGLVIGRGGETFKQIRSETFWVPKIERVPSIKSDIIEGIRKVIHTEVKFRKEFLNKTGESIFTERKTNRDWIRVIGLGACREVGRNCFLVETPKSRVLLDCGINVGGSDSNVFPYLQAKEFDYNELDAIIVSHSHLDHLGCVPMLYEHGYNGPLYCSVDYEEPVIIQIDGNIKIVKIGEIIDRLLEKSKNKLQLSKNEFVLANVSDKIKVATFSQNDFKIYFKQLKNVVRHKLEGKLYEITLKTGRKVKVTGSHSIFALKNGRIVPMRVDELKVGDYVVVPYNLPNDVELREINIAEILKDKQKRIYIFKENRRIPLPKVKKIEKNDKIGLRRGWKIPAILDLTSELMRIIGYFLAEGNFEERGIRFNFGLHEENLGEDVVCCISKVFDGLKAKTRHKKTSLTVEVNSLLVKLLFEHFFNGTPTATEKRVPSLIFKVRKKLKLEFLRAYLKGDGSTNPLNKTIWVATPNKNLIEDLSYLSLCVGLAPAICSYDAPTALTSSKVHQITFNLTNWTRCNGGAANLHQVASDLIPLEETNFGSDWIWPKIRSRKHITRQRLVDLLIKRKRIKTSEENREYLLKIATSDLAFLPVIKIEEVKPSTQYVYDFSVEGENFVGGLGGICLHNTTPTIDLATLLWLDYIDVMQRNAVNPIFTAKGVKEAVKHSIPLEYGEVSDVAPDVRLTFQNAGHILGSGLIHLHIGEGLHNIVYACDVKFGRTTLLDPAFTDFQRVETLILESTYGGVDDIMPPRQEAEKQLMEIINKTMERNGCCLIPSFAVERAQDVMAILVENNFQYPVFIDGMIWDATGIYTAYPEYVSGAIQKKIFSGKDPFLSEIFKRVASPQEREKVLEQRPCVIISTSGMLVGGPAINYLQNLAEDPKSTLLFVGYQGEGTLGRRIQKGWKEIPMRVENGRTITLNLQMEVQTIDGLSGHSDRNQLLSFVHRLAAKPDKVIVVHGENQKAVELARSIHKLFRIETVAPRNLESIRLK